MRPEVPPRPARRIHGTLAVWIGLSLILLARPVVAGPITFAYDGTVDSADPATGVAPGTRFSGTFRYDPDALTTSIQIANAQWFSFGGPAMAGADPADTSAISVRVGDRYLVDQQGKLGLNVFRNGYPPYDTDGTTVVLSNGSSFWQDVQTGITAALSLGNPDEWVLKTPYGLPDPEELNLAALPSSRLEVFETRDGTTRTLYAGRVDGLAIVPTPEPATIALLGLGVTGWLVRSRTIRRRD